MKLEVGQTYQTRGSDRVEIIEIANLGIYSCIGVYLSGKYKGCKDAWASDGCFNIYAYTVGGDGDRDLILKIEQHELSAGVWKTKKGEIVTISEKPLLELEVGKKYLSASGKHAIIVEKFGDTFRGYFIGLRRIEVWEGDGVHAGTLNLWEEREKKLPSTYVVSPDEELNLIEEIQL